MAMASTPKLYQLLPNLSFLVVFSFFITTHLSSSPSNTLHLRTPHPTISQHGCKSIEGLKDYWAKCSYIKTHDQCLPKGYIDYLYIFYCICGRYPFVGYTVLALWLLVLFYLSANTASRYFCSSLEGLSRLLGIPPSLAGATLLALGNGAPDVFASIVSFAGSGVGEVGLSSILGGAFFVSSVVVGVIGICVGSRSIHIDRSSFVRDVCFFLVVLGSLLVILIDGRVYVLGSICFASLYIVYVILVSAPHCCRGKNDALVVPILDGEFDERDYFKHDSPLLVDRMEDGEFGGEDWMENQPNYFKPDWSNSKFIVWLVYLLEMPLYLPRRLSIPDVREELWSKPFAVISVTLSPILLSILWNTEIGEMNSVKSMIIFLSAGLMGIVLGITAMVTTECSQPPRKCLLPWLAGGFLMSVVWAYIITRELVALLVSMGHILSINPAVLGLTVLAWGNSIGDLIANVAIAVGGGDNGVQIAISGCYAGPIFNTLVGLGTSLVFSSWGNRPSGLVITYDKALFETLGFLVCGLLWALVMLLSREMRLDRVLGVGLLVIYLCFLCLRIWESVGLVQ